MSENEFFHRKWSLKIQADDGITPAPGFVRALDFSDFDMEFSVKKTILSTPNTCKVTVYNMNDDHRKAFQSLKENYIELSAGYVKGNFGVIYRGELRSAYSVKVKQDWVTTIETADGAGAMAAASVNAAVPPNASGANVLDTLGKALGFKSEDLDKIKARFGDRFNKQLFGSRGGILNGNAAVNMNELCRQTGTQWSVQDGKLQINKIDTPVDGIAYVLDSKHGLIGSPAIEAKGKPNKQAHVLSKKELGLHLVTATSLLNPALVPGGKVNIDSRHVTGTYRIVEVEHTGTTHGTPWYSKIKAQPV